MSERPVRRAYRLQTILFVHGTRFADLLPEGTSMSVEFKDMVPVEGVLRLVTDTGLFLLVQNDSYSWMRRTCSLYRLTSS